MNVHMKTHMSINGGTACNRGKIVTENVRQVTCLLCKDTPVFIEIKENADAARHQAFMAQEPRACSAQFGGPVTCSSCAGTLFRIGDRSCYGHYENYHCANCGHVESRLTETGMCF